MAKGFGVLLVLFGALVCVHQRNEGVFVGAGDMAVYVNTAERYVNAALRYMKPAEAEERVVYVKTADPYAKPVDSYAKPDGRYVKSARGSYVNPVGSYVKPAKAYVNGVDAAEPSARDRLQEIYMAEVGVRELSGRNDGERVAEYLRYTDLGEGYAWCASFVSWVYGQAGYSEPRTAWSPSLFPTKRVIWEKGRVPEKRQMVRPPEPQSGARGTGFLMTDKKSAAEQAKDNTFVPKKGDVFGIYFRSVKRIAHAGFVDEWGDKYVVTVEGNTNEAGSREGDGVYRKRRPVSSIYRVASWL